MAQVTTTSGYVVHFDPEAIVLVTADGAGGQGSALAGVLEGLLHTTGAPAQLLQDLGIASSFVRLTRPDGSSVWLKASAVSAVRVPLQQEYPAAVNAVIRIGGATQGVGEGVQAVVDSVNQAGGRL